MYLRSEEDISAVISHRMLLGKSSLYAITYLDGACGRLHDSILGTLSNAFFAGLPERNHLSSKYRVSSSDKADFARRLGKDKEYYRSSQYDVAWQNACYTAISEAIPTDVFTCRKIQRQSPLCEVPQLPNQPPSHISLYFLEFLVLKIVLIFSIYFLQYLYHTILTSFYYTNKIKLNGKMLVTILYSTSFLTCKPKCQYTTFCVRRTSS